MQRRTFSLGLAAAAVLGVLAGCAYGPGLGPPPHAPAHGYRRKHRGVELVYDRGLGLYVAAGLPGLYYSNGLFYRLEGGAWQASAAPDGPWRPAGARRLPPGLAKQGGRLPPGQRKKTE